MSILVYKGDPTDNFGEFLPVPYIEKIEIHNDGGYEIVVALFLTVKEDEDVEAVKARLNAVDAAGKRLLTNYILLVVNKPDNRIETLLNNEMNIFNFYERAKHDPIYGDGTTSRTTLEELDFFGGDAELTDDFYDINGSRILKFTIYYGSANRDGSAIVLPESGVVTGVPGMLTSAYTPPDPAYTDAALSTAATAVTAETAVTGVFPAGELLLEAQTPTFAPSYEDASTTVAVTFLDCASDSDCFSGETCCDGKCKKPEDCYVSAGSDRPDQLFDFEVEQHLATEDSKDPGAPGLSTWHDLYYFANGDPFAGMSSAEDASLLDCLSNADCLVGTECCQGKCRDPQDCAQEVQAGTGLPGYSSPDDLPDQLFDTTPDTAMAVPDDRPDQLFDTTTDTGTGLPGYSSPDDRPDQLDDTTTDTGTETLHEDFATPMGDSGVSGEYDPTDTEGMWNWVNNFWIFTFSSTFDYYGDTTAELSSSPEMHEKLANKALFEKEISDIAYEPVFVDGKIAPGIEAAYFDAEGAVYNGHPLQAFSGLYYKTESITHHDVIKNIKQLISQYSPGDGTPLKKMINNINFILETYRRDVTLIKQLQRLVKVFPNKDGATDLGKFYFRYKRRVAANNKKLKNNPQVAKRVIRNSKILDLRAGDTPVYTPPDVWVPSGTATDSYYIYNASYIDRTAIYSAADGAFQVSGWDEGDWAWGFDPDTWNYTNFDVDLLPEDADAIIRNFGYFFFDYEKALKKIANINQIVSVEALEAYGIETAYEYFRVKEASISRNVYIDGWWLDPYPVTITSEFDEGALSPLTKTTTLDNQSEDYKMAIFRPGFYTDSSEVPGAPLLREDQFTSLIFRNFEPMDSNGISPTIPNYRLMAFQFQDFMDDDEIQYYNPIPSYTATVVIEDNSIDNLTALIDEFENALSAVTAYRDDALAEASLSHDEITGLFNRYFTEGIEMIYEDNKEDAPWYRAPILYNIFKDMFYNTFENDLSLILEDSARISGNINPRNGSYYALEEFVTQMQKFYDDNLTADTEIKNAIAALKMDGTATHTLAVDTLEYTDDPEDVYGVLYIN